MDIKTKEKLNIQDITIPENYKKHPPRGNKMKEKWEYYRQNNKLEEEIIVNEHNVLIDGYTSYLIAEADGIKKVNVTKKISEPWFVDTSNSDDNQGYICVYRENTKKKQTFDNDIHKGNDMYIKGPVRVIQSIINKYIIPIMLIANIIIIVSFIWMFAQIVQMCLEVGG